MEAVCFCIPASGFSWLLKEILIRVMTIGSNNNRDSDLILIIGVVEVHTW